MKEALAGVIAAIVYVLFVMFVSWGSSPATWTNSDRFGTGCFFIITVGAAVLFTRTLTRRYR